MIEQPSVPECRPAIRAFAAGDLPALQTIRQAAFEPIFRSFRDIVGDDIARIAFARADAEQAKLLAELCAADSGHHVFVVTAGQEIAGFVSVRLDADTRIGEIGLNAVHPDHAGKGIGTWMYGQVMAHMKRHGMALATVGVGGDTSHKAAWRAYGKAGFGPGIPSVYLYKLL